MSSLRITIDQPPNALKPNTGRRMHHAAIASARTEYREHCQEEALHCCHEQNITEPFSMAVVGITYYHKTATLMDRDNILASLKTAFDGFTRAGVWTDDRDVIYLPPARKVDRACPRVEVVIYRGQPEAWSAFVESLKG